MPGADKIVVELEAKTSSFIASIGKAARSHENLGVSLQKTSKDMKGFLEKSQKGQEAVLQKTVKSYEQASKTVTVTMGKGAEAQSKAIEVSTTHIIGRLEEQIEAKRKTASASEEAFAKIRESVAKVSLKMLVQEGLELETAYRQLSQNMSQFSDVLGDSEFALSSMNSVATEAGVPLQNLEGVTAAAVQTVKELGGSGDDVFLFGELVAKGASLASDGSTTIEDAMENLASQIKKPVIELSDYNSIVKESPRLAQAFADGIDEANGSVSRLGSLISSGQIAGTDLFQALLSQSGAIRAEFETLEQGPVEAMNRLNNQILEFVGTSEIAATTSQGFAAILNFVADNFEVFGNAAIIASAAVTGFYGRKGLTAATAISGDMIKKLKGLNLAAIKAALGLKGAGNAAKFLKASLAFPGVVAVIAAIAAAFLLLRKNVKSTKDVIGETKTTLSNYQKAVSDIDRDTELLRKRNEELAAAIAKTGDAAQSAARLEIDAIRKRLNKNKELKDSYLSLLKSQLALAKSTRETNDDDQLSRLTGVSQTKVVGQRGGGNNVTDIRKRKSDSVFRDEANAVLEEQLKLIRRIGEEGGTLTKKQEKILKFDILRGEELKEIATLEAQIAEANQDEKIREIEGLFEAMKKAEMDLADAKKRNAEDDLKRADERLSAVKRDIDEIKKAAGAQELLEIEVIEKRIVSGVDVDAVAQAQKVLLISEEELVKAKEISSKVEIERAEKKLAIVKRTLELLNSGFSDAQAKRIANKEFAPKPPSSTSTEDGTETETGTSAENVDDAEARARELDRQIEAIKKIGQIELDQIKELRAARKTAIDEYAMREGVSAEEVKKLREKADKEKQDALDEIERRKANARIDEMGYIAEINAAIARMNGRAVEATQIELDATKARYKEELRLLDEVIEKKGKTAELEAERSAILAKIAGVDESEKDFKNKTIEDFQDVSDGAQPSEPRSALDQLLAERDEKLAFLEKFKSEDVEIERARQEEITQVMEEYEQRRLDLLKQAQKNRIDEIEGSIALVTKTLKTLGLEGTKAAKIAAKAQQGIALGRAAVNTAVAVTEAAQALPFPLNIPGIAFAAATGAAQIATIAAQTFRDGGVNILGPGTGTSDSIPARISRGESVITAAATRGNEAGLLGLNNGLSPADAFGLPVIHPPMPNLSVPSISSSSGNRNFRSGDVIVQGNVERETMPQFLAALAERDRKFSSNVNRIIDARERRTISRRERVLGR